MSGEIGNCSSKLSEVMGSYKSSRTTIVYAARCFAAPNARVWALRYSVKITAKRLKPMSYTDKSGWLDVYVSIVKRTNQVAHMREGE